jgi:hypothetical protein
MDVRVLKKHVWPYSTTLKRDDLRIKEWCDSTVGIRFRDWYSYYLDDKKGITYAFKDEATMLVFKLKWGNLQ